MTLCSCKSKPLFKLNLDEKAKALEREMPNFDTDDLKYAKDLNNSNAIRVAYVGNEKGSLGHAEWIDLRKEVLEATLSYEVYFEKDFQWVKGGKLLGLAPDNVIRGGRPSNPDGWSVRVMFKPKGKIGSYIYHQNRKGKFGDTKISDSIVFTKGKYSKVSLYVKVNKPATEKNGIMELWVDGERVIYRNDIQYRAIEGKQTLINKFIFSTFHGGGRSSYAPKDNNGNYITVHAWFKNIEVYEGKHITFSSKTQKQ